MAGAAVMSHHGTTHVLSSGILPDCAGGTPTDFSASQRLQTIYDADSVTIWHVRG